MTPSKACVRTWNKNWNPDIDPHNVPMDYARGFAAGEKRGISLALPSFIMAATGLALVYLTSCTRPLLPPERNVVEPAPVVVGPLMRGQTVRRLPR